MTSFNANLT